MAIKAASGFPVAAIVESASPHEVTLFEDTVDNCFTKNAPYRLIGDKAYDSDGLDQQFLEDRGIELIAPNRAGRKGLKTQDGRKLRRIGAVGGLNASLHCFHFRRISIRYEYHLASFLAFVQLACPVILRRFFRDGL
jgi:hypothetical protein